MSLMRVTAIGLAVAWSGAAMAATTPAEQAAEMLSRIQAVDTKCNFLAAADKDVLSSLVAKAELNLARRESVAQTKAALQRGRDAGKGASCNTNEKENATSILAAAKEATTEADAAKTNDTAPEQPLQAARAPEPTPAVKPVQKTLTKLSAAKPKKQEVAGSKPAATRKSSQTKLKPITGGSLAGYSALTERYYIARRCNSMSQRQISNLYGSIVSVHSKLMATQGAGQVASALKRGANRANAKGCS